LRDVLGLTAAMGRKLEVKKPRRLDSVRGFWEGAAKA
jgi:hypothetical protein